MTVRGYYDRWEIVRKCPECGKLMLCGPPMTSEEKQIAMLKGMKSYSNFWKHVYKHSPIVTENPEIGDTVKKYPENKRHAFIMQNAKEFLKDKHPEYKHDG